MTWFNPNNEDWQALNKRGRPRTVSPPIEETTKLGKELVKWVIENKPTHLSEWFSIHMQFTWRQWDTLCALDDFVPYYEMALSLVAKFSRDGTLDKSIAQRFLSLYHRDLKAEERETAKYNADLKKEADKEVNLDLLAKQEEFNSQLRILREGKKSKCQESDK